MASSGRFVQILQKITKGTSTGPKHGSLLSPLPSVKTLGSKPSGRANKGWLILSVAACLCGMATSRSWSLRPCLLLLYDRAFVSGSFRSALANRRWYYTSLAATWLWLGFLMHRSTLAAASVGFRPVSVGLPIALTELGVVTDYLKLAFWPHPLVFDYGSEILATKWLAVVPYAVIIGAILVGVAFAWRRSADGGISRLLVLFDSGAHLDGGANCGAADWRRAACICRWRRWSCSRHSWVYALGGRRAFVILGLMAVGLGGLTVQRNYDYRSELSIWKDTVARHPLSLAGTPISARHLCRNPDVCPRRSRIARRHYASSPAYAEAHNNLAIALAKMPGRESDAIAHAEEACV